MSQLDKENVKEKLDHVAKLVDVCKESNSLSQKLYVKCSTHVKSTAIEIAHRENSFLKRAIKFKEISDLDEVMFHYKPNMLRMYLLILHKLPMPVLLNDTDSDTIMECESPSIKQNPIVTPVTNNLPETLLPNSLPEQITETNQTFEATSRCNTTMSTSRSKDVIPCTFTNNNTNIRTYIQPVTIVSKGQ